MCWVHPAGATFPQNCTLILDMYPVASEIETLLPAFFPAGITFRSHQRAPKYRSSRAHHTTTTDLSNPPFASTLPALNIQWHTNRQQSIVGKHTDQPKSECCRPQEKHVVGTAVEHNSCRAQQTGRVENPIHRADRRWQAEGE